MSEVVEMEIINSGILDRLFKAIHQLTPTTARPPVIEDVFVLGRILP
jgi:hypothetical protein